MEPGDLLILLFTFSRRKVNNKKENKVRKQE